MSNASGSSGNLKPHILMADVRSIGWWYWLLCAGLLTANAFGWAEGFLLAIGLTVLQVLHFALRDRTVRSFPVQVRLAYLLLLLVAVPQQSRFICWIPTIGTWVMVLFGYCAMARTVSLAPWNRVTPLSIALLKQTFLSAPVRGSFMQAASAVQSSNQRALIKRSG